MKNLILITNHFPYTTGETFLRTEVPFLIQGFDKVIIVTRNVRAVDKYPGEERFATERIDPESDFREMLETLLWGISHPRKVVINLFREWNYLRIKRTPAGLKRSGTLLHDLGKAIALSRQLERVIETHKLSGTVTLYSYWLTSAALATLLVRPKNIVIKRIARAHGSDVYESVQLGGYLSFREILAQGLDRIFPVSSHGLNYLRRSVDARWRAKFQLSRMGTLKPESSALLPTPSRMTIVSCSSLIPLKRVHLIIDALTEIHSVDVQWIHFGDGPLLQELENRAANQLSLKKNIRYRFYGTISNEELLNYYRTSYVELFINTSSSEGIPVSIMEAQSFGIPAIAMNVGGVGEIITGATGILLDAAATATEIAHTITRLLMLPDDEKNQIRKNAFHQWETEYNAQKNYSNFVALIQSL